MKREGGGRGGDEGANIAGSIRGPSTDIGISRRAIKLMTARRAVNVPSAETRRASAARYCGGQDRSPPVSLVFSSYEGDGQT